jgi:soluble cytochrome b562
MEYPHAPRFDKLSLPAVEMLEKEHMQPSGASVPGEKSLRENNARLSPSGRVKGRSTMTKPSFPGFATALLFGALLATPILCHAQGDGPKTPLSQEMGGISKDFRALHKALGDPSQQAAAVALVKDMEAHAQKAKTYNPAKTKDVPAADKDQFVADYQKAIDGLIADLQKLEQAVSSGDTAGANALMDKIQGDKRDGHKKFNAQDDHGPRGGWGGGPGGGPGGPGGGPGAPGAGGPPPGGPMGGN